MPTPAELLTAKYTISKSPGEPPRSPQWEATRKAFVEKYPHCAVCSATKAPVARELNVHHVVPFDLVIHVGRPDLELDPRNLITLCEAGENHHHVVGHLCDWESYNKNVRTDAARPDCHGHASTQIEKLTWWLQEQASKPAHYAQMTDAQKGQLKALLDKMYPGVA